jgi:predicted ATPase
MHERTSRDRRRPMKDWPTSMLSRWTLTNFKSYYKENTIELAPLTILCGANSSGKNSILQSMLLIKQTLEHSPSERVIALNGPLVQLGTFSDILNETQAKADEREIGIGWRIYRSPDPLNQKTKFIGEYQVSRSDIDFVFDASGPIGDRATLELQPDLKSASMSATLTDGSSEQHDVLLKIERVTGRGRRLQYDSSTLGDEAKLRFKTSLIDPETRDAAGPGLVPSKVVGASVHHFSPSGLIVRYDRNLRLAKQAASIIADTARVSRFGLAPIALSESVRGAIAEALHELSLQPRYGELIKRLLADQDTVLTAESFRNRLRESQPMLRRAVREALLARELTIAEAIYEEIGSDVTVSLSRVEQITKTSHSGESYFRFLLRYLGPLRADPRPLYPLQALGSPTDVGPKGEQTAAVLHLNAKRSIGYIPAKAFNDSPVGSEQADVPLSEAVGDWLSYLGVAEAFETIEKGKLGHELRVRTPGTTEFQDLTNVGVGVSQILPIVVTCLLASPGSTIILEQPELHLHPAVQARLADFFISMILLGKQCIVETHSEHLIERIRFRVAQDWSNKIHDSAKIYFFEKVDGSTRSREVSVNRFGSIDDWPDDFFDQSQRANEQIVLMALERHRDEKMRQKAVSE